jgi:hypothetical protein
MTITGKWMYGCWSWVGEGVTRGVNIYWAGVTKGVNIYWAGVTRGVNICSNSFTAVADVEIKLCPFNLADSLLVVLGTSGRANSSCVNDAAT